jgi:hypothetical protein
MAGAAGERPLVIDPQPPSAPFVALGFLEGRGERAMQQGERKMSINNSESIQGGKSRL